MDISNDKKSRITPRGWFKLVIILLLAILLIQILTSGGFDSCDKCRFDYNNKTLHTSQMLTEYENKCFKQDLNINFSDVSIG